MPTPSSHNTYVRQDDAPAEESPHSFDMAHIAELVGQNMRGRYADEEPVGIPEGFQEEPDEERPPEVSVEKEEQAPEAGVDELREKVRALEQGLSMRLSQQGQLDQGALTQSVIAAILAAKQAERYAEPPQMPSPPKFLTTPIDLVADDPAKLQETIDESNRKAAMWAYEQAQQQLQGAYSQQHQALQGVNQLLNEFAPLLASHARSEAASFGGQNSMWSDDRERDEMLQQAEQLLASQTAAPTAIYKPDAWKAALQYISLNKPRKVQGQVRSPVSAGDGDANVPVAGTPGGRDMSSSAVARMAAQLAGRKPTSEELETFAKRSPGAFA